MPNGPGELIRKRAVRARLVGLPKSPFWANSAGGMSMMSTSGHAMNSGVGLTDARDRTNNGEMNQSQRADDRANKVPNYLRDHISSGHGISHVSM